MVNLTATVATGSSPIAVAVTSTRIYAVDLFGASIWATDATSHAFVSSIAVGGFPGYAARTADRSQLWVPCSTNVVSVIDTATDMVTATSGLAGGPNSVAFAAV